MWMKARRCECSVNAPVPEYMRWLISRIIGKKLWDVELCLRVNVWQVAAQELHEELPIHSAYQLRDCLSRTSLLKSSYGESTVPSQVSLYPIFAFTSFVSFGIHRIHRCWIFHEDVWKFTGSCSTIRPPKKWEYCLGEGRRTTQHPFTSSSPIRPEQIGFLLSRFAATPPIGTACCHCTLLSCEYPCRIYEVVVRVQLVINPRKTHLSSLHQSIVIYFTYQCCMVVFFIPFDFLIVHFPGR